MQGITRLHDTVSQIKNALNPALQFGGMFLVRYRPREELSRTVRETAELISQSLGVPLLKTAIRSSVAVAKAQAMQKDMVKSEPHNHAVQDYLDLTDELLEGGL